MQLQLRTKKTPSILSLVKSKLQVNLPKYTNLFVAEKINVLNAVIESVDTGNTNSNGDSIIQNYCVLSLDKNIIPSLALNPSLLTDDWNVIANNNYKNTSRIFVRNLYSSIDCSKIEILPAVTKSNSNDFHDNLLKLTLTKDTYLYYTNQGLNLVYLTDFYATFYNGNNVTLKDFSGGYYVAANDFIPKEELDKKEANVLFLHIPKDIVNDEDLQNIFGLRNFKPKTAEIATINQLPKKDGSGTETKQVRLVYEIFRLDNSQNKTNSTGTFGGNKKLKDLQISKDGKQIKYKVSYQDAVATPVVLSQYNLQTEICINDNIEIVSQDISDFVEGAAIETQDISDSVEEAAIETNDRFTNNYHQLFIIPSENSRRARDNVTGVDYIEDYKKQREGSFALLLSIDTDKLQQEGGQNIIVDNYINREFYKLQAFNKIQEEVLGGIDIALNGYTLQISESFLPISTTLSNEAHSPVPTPKNLKKYWYQVTFVYNYMLYAIANDSENPQNIIENITGYIDSAGLVSKNN